MHPEIVSLDSVFAFEVRGLATWSPLDRATVRALDDTWSTQGVMVFRRQSISEEELLRISTAFGEPERIVRADWASDEHPEITRISNLRNAEGSPIGGLGSGELDWHTDQSYMAVPATGALLHAVEIPDDGPKTYWANLQLAYDALPQSTKTAIADLRGEFSYAKRVGGYDQETTAEEIRRMTPDVTHALVHTHPVTGKKALYLDPATMTGVEGMSEEKGNALLAELVAHATRTAFVYRHDWRPGDIVMWDNGFLMHRRDAFNTGQNRLLKRTTIRLSPRRHIIPT